MIRDAFICQLIPADVVEELEAIEKEMMAFAEKAHVANVDPTDPLFRMSVVTVWLVRELFKVRRRVRGLSPLS